MSDFIGGPENNTDNGTSANEIFCASLGMDVHDGGGGFDTFDFSGLAGPFDFVQSTATTLTIHHNGGDLRPNFLPFSGKVSNSNDLLPQLPLIVLYVQRF